VGSWVVGSGQWAVSGQWASGQVGKWASGQVGKWVTGGDGGLASGGSSTARANESQRPTQTTATATTTGTANGDLDDEGVARRLESWRPEFGIWKPVKASFRRSQGFCWQADWTLRAAEGQREGGMW
jgi:hypothetical protein